MFTLETAAAQARSSPSTSIAPRADTMRPRVDAFPIPCDHPRPPTNGRSPPATTRNPTDMDDAARKTALRMIPYGLYVMTAEHGDEIAAATVNWVTQTAFAPPLVVVGVKVDSGAYTVGRAAGHFALNVLGKGQQGVAFGFFKPAEKDGNTISGEPYRKGSTGAPLLDNAIASVECRLVEVLERGDHHIFVGEVVDAHVARQPEGRPDEAVLEMKELGSNVFYGG